MIRRVGNTIPLVLGLAFSLGVHLAAGWAYVDSRAAVPLPDLVAESLDADPPLIAGQPARVALTVANGSVMPIERFTIAWRIDDQPIASVEVQQPLGPGGRMTVSQSLNDVSAGVHVVRAVVDADRRITESREDNNRIERTLVWRADQADRAAGEAALPDLVVAAIRPAGPLVAGQRSRLIVDIANLGHAPAGPHVLRLAVDDEPLVDLPIDESLPPGRVASVPVDITIDEPGEHRLCAAADADEQLPEIHEDNNGQCVTLTWRAEPDTLLGSTDGQGLQVRLISAEQFEQIQTPVEFAMDQPMLQTTADPTPTAPIEIVDPTDPAPTASPSTPQPPTPRIDRQPQPPEPATASDRPTEPDAPDPGAPEPAIDEVAEATRAPAAEVPADQAVAPAEGEAQPTESIEQVGETDRINVLTDQTERATEIDDRANFAGDAEAIVRNIQPPVAPNEITDAGQLPRAIDEGRVDEQVEQVGSKTEPADDADPADATADLAGAIDVPRELPAMPTDPDRDAQPASPDSVESDQPNDPTSAAPTDRADQPAPATQTEPPTEQPDDQPTEPAPDATAQPTKPAPASAPSQANPTAAMRSDAESPPVSRIAYASIKPGGVEAVQGVKIKTVVPRYSTVARMTAVPGNPSYRVHFNGEGRVSKVEQLQGTGYVNVDAPIITALYKWTAEGEFDADGFTIERLDIQLNLRE